MKFFQMFSRNNDINGNPYRLIIVREIVNQSDILICAAFEARSSSPNICHALRKDGVKEIGGVHLAPMEYNRLKKDINKYHTQVMPEN